MLLDLHCPVKRHFVHGTIGTPLLDFISISVSFFFLLLISQVFFLCCWVSVESYMFLFYFVPFVLVKFKNLTGSFLDRERLTQPFISDFNASFGCLVNVIFLDLISGHCLFTPKCDLVTYSSIYLLCYLSLFLYILLLAVSEI